MKRKTWFYITLIFPLIIILGLANIFLDKATFTDITNYLLSGAFPYILFIISGIYLLLRKKFKSKKVFISVLYIIMVLLGIFLADFIDHIEFSSKITFLAIVFLALITVLSFVNRLLAVQLNKRNLLKD